MGRLSGSISPMTVDVMAILHLLSGVIVGLLALVLAFELPITIARFLPKSRGRLHGAALFKFSWWISD